MIASDPSSGVVFVSIATNGRGGSNIDPDIVYPKLGGGTYRLWGIPDGMGGFRSAEDVANNTFTLLVNHEIGSGSGGVKAHGANGATVSKWTIKADANDLQVIGGADLMTTVKLWDSGTNGYVTNNSRSFGRFCSADLAEQSAYQFGDFGTAEKLFMNGEESGASGVAMAHIASGPNAGTSYELPRLGKFSWENSVASPFPQLKTVVIGADDSTPGNIYVYVGTKTDSGSEIDRAGLTNGNLYAVAMTGTTVNSSGQNIESYANILGNATSGPVQSKAFALYNYGDVTNLSGAQLQTIGDTNGQMNFNRPEDVAFDPRNPNVAYFVTTADINNNSRLWKIEFNDITQPELGGTISMLLDGNVMSSASGGWISATGLTRIRMMDNISVTRSGYILIQEDVGNDVHLGRMWMYDVYTDKVTEVGISDARYFLSGGSQFLTQDEETSGVFEAWDILGPGWHLLCMQAHYTNNNAGLSEGAQLLALYIPQTRRLCRADFNADSVLDFNDYLDFVADFSGNTAAADFNADGVIDFFDYLDFVAAFAAGC
jgi:hypothetical protein